MDRSRQVLWRFSFDGSDAELRAIRASLPDLKLYRAVEGRETYAYLDIADSLDVPDDTPLANGEHVQLQCICSMPGASFGADAPYHYVVATDIPAEHESDFNAWYETEHLPGLAAVPGTVLARRFLCDGPGPRYHACYDLASLCAFNSPPWLAVRATDWSSRIRPHFRNTRRVMFRRV